MRTTSALLGALTAGVLVSLGASVPLARGDARPATIPVSEVKDGMKGYGLTVFKGTEPERFDVEVIGVLHHFRPGEPLIVIKTPNPRLDVVKTVRGMSGSPIYLDGRLAGAYAYSLSSFEVEPVAGVTPIAPMLSELARPTPPGFWPLAGRGPVASAPTMPPAAPPEGRRPRDSHATGFLGAPGQYDVAAHAAQLAERMGDPAATNPGGASYTRASTPLLLAGVGDRTAAMLRTFFGPLGLEPLQTGGGQGPSTGAPMHFVDGGGLGVEMVRGDISMLGLGTVTHVEGTKLVGFGHPMMSAGDSALPTSIGRVLWINASAQRSFKVGESARALGTLVQDRQSAVVIDETKQAPTFPVSINVVGADGAPKRAWHMEVAEERFMSPTLTAGALASVVEATVSEQRDVTWQMKSKVSIRGHGALELEDYGVAIGGMPDQGELGRSRVVHAIGDLLNNPWEEVAIDKIESTLSVKYTRDLWHLRGVELADEVVDAGKPAHVRLRLVPYEGREVVREVEVMMPPELGGTDVEIDVQPGYDVAPEIASPESLSDLLANETRQSLLPRSVVLQFKSSAPAVVLRGELAPRLPGFAFDALRPAHSDTGGEQVPSYVRTVVPLDRYLEGHDKVKVKVRRVMR